MDKKQVLYSGKAKTLYATADENRLVAEFRDDTSAFDGEKKAKLANKGAINNQFNAFIMKKLEEAGLKTHFVELLNNTESLVKTLEMIPVECVVRNYAAGSLCRRLGIEKGRHFEKPLFEFFLKNDELHDPMICDEHIRAFGYAKESEISKLKELTHQVNALLTPLFDNAGMLLVDFKLEFGRAEGELLLGDEFTPDGCRVWDKETHESLDKDRFRQSLGDVVESYQVIAERLGLEAQFD